MIPYLIIFTIIIIITYFMEKNKRKGNKILSKILLVCIILLISAFAGVRDETVGTDVNVYATPTLIRIGLYGFEYTYETAKVEIAFVVLAQITYWLNADIHTLLFFVQLIITIFTVLYIDKNSEGKSMTLYMATYLCMFFGIGLNLMRQSMAMAIVLFSYLYVKKKKLIPFLIAIYIATLFHTTAIFMVVLYPIYRLLESKSKTIYKFVILATLTALLVGIQPLMQLLIQTGMLTDKFTHYIYDMQNSTMNVQSILTCFKLFLLFVCYWIQKFDHNNKQESNMAFFFLLVDFILFQLGAITPFIERISYYFALIGYLEIIPKMGNVVKQDNFNKFTIKFLTYAVLIGYFYLNFDFLGISQIMPYTSSILNIL